MKVLLTLALLLCVQLNRALPQTALTNATNGFRPGYSCWLHINYFRNKGYFPASAEYTNRIMKVWDFHEITTATSSEIRQDYCYVDSGRVTALAAQCALSTDDYIITSFSGSSFVYNIPDTVMKFPMKNGDRFATSYTATNPVSSPGYYHTKYGSSSVTVMSTGTLILPHCSFDNVLLVKAIREVTDSVHNTYDTALTTRVVSYRWYSPIQREFLMIIDSTFNTDKWFVAVRDTNVMSGFTSGSPFLEASELTRREEIKVYPNPAKNELNITGQDMESISVCSLLGQEVITSKCAASHAGIDISLLPGGMYIVSVLHADGTRSVSRFIRQ